MFGFDRWLFVCSLKVVWCAIVTFTSDRFARRQQDDRVHRDIFEIWFSWSRTRYATSDATRSMCQRMNQKVFSRDRSCSIFFTPLVFPSHGQFSFLIGFSSHTWWSPHFHSVSIRFLDRPRFTAVLQNNARVSFNTKKYINRSRAISFLFF